MDDLSAKRMVFAARIARTGNGAPLLLSSLLHPAHHHSLTQGIPPALWAAPCDGGCWPGSPSPSVVSGTVLLFDTPKGWPCVRLSTKRRPCGRSVHPGSGGQRNTSALSILHRHRLSTAHAPPVHRFSTAYAMPTHWLCSASALPMRLLSAAYALPTYASSLHCRCIAWALPMHWLRTASPLPMHCL